MIGGQFGTASNLSLKIAKANLYSKSVEKAKQLQDLSNVVNGNYSVKDLTRFVNRLTKDNRITDFNLVLNIIKENIYTIEQKLNFTFKETILILNNFDCSFINLTGFKKLNGSQILKENITYILNSLKSNINETEDKKYILHIFNSKFVLDKKKVDNLPIGLFGDFYSRCKLIQDYINADQDILEAQFQNELYEEFQLEMYFFQNTHVSINRNICDNSFINYG